MSTGHSNADFKNCSEPPQIMAQQKQMKQQIAKSAATAAAAKRSGK
jgi:hypothetical protein